MNVAVDQEARDGVGRVLAMIERHIAICDERELRYAAIEAKREQMDRERDARHERYLQDLKEQVVSIKDGYDRAYSDMSHRDSNFKNSSAISISELSTQLHARQAEYEKTNNAKIEKVQSRWWALVAGGFVLALGVIGTLLAYLGDFIFKKVTGT